MKALKGKLKFYWEEIRIYQWVKNLLIFTPIVFVGWLFDFLLLARVVLAFISFSLAASSVYVLNDIFDLPFDKAHPKKRFRPLASGSITIAEAKVILIILLVPALAIAFYLGWPFFSILVFYLFLNFAYSWRLKYIVILDLMLVAAMYLIRVFAGALVINVEVSSWLLLTTLFISLFIVSAKRRNEITVGQANKTTTRQVLVDYNIELLNQLLVITNMATIVFYALYTMKHSGLFVWSIFFVIYAMFRYLYLVFVKGKGGEPEKLLLKDKPILFSIFAWAIFVIILLYFYF